MHYLVVLEKGPTSYGAFVPDIPGCIAVGGSEAEATALIQDAIQLHLEDLHRGGKPIPEAVSKSTFVEIGLAG